ncbi:hypothetical protein IW262DRAFT_1292930 [Armillaria fumosa]|nr:hypothetical protein IW262DRAFT_1292930 [Armillaria fumosa]
MTEKPQQSDFTAATGFGHEEEAFLTKNAACFHHYESLHSFFGNLWLEWIWEVFILYWPPAERTDSMLAGHREHVRQALRWIYKRLDPETCKAEQASIRFPQVYYPGPIEPRRTTIRPPQPSQPLNIVPPPPILHQIACYPCC